MKYAAETSVSTEQSQAEIRKTLNRYGAERFAYYEEDLRAAIMFEMKGRRIKFLLPLPSKNDRQFWQTPERRTARSADAALKSWEQACRQRWRALALAIKAKLESVESGIASFEEEFYAFIVLPTGKTIYEETHAAVEQAYLTGKMPLLLPGIGETSQG